MVFSSVPFLYYFLPIVILLYFGLPRRFANGVLLLASLIFYGYGEPRYLLLMGASILAAWALGLLIPRSRAVLYLSVCVSLGLLLWFKYADFFVESFAAATGIDAEPLGIALPIGISFYTFQILSYTIDVGRGRIKPQRSLLRFATYVALFPQLIAGPIVIYSTVESQLDPLNRRIDIRSIYEGSRRFIIGLSKKVLLANSLGELVLALSQMPEGEQSVAGYWLLAAGFSLQIYFDFSGYSDMAIGLGRVFGFAFPENFNYPYIARSVTEFWRRWHMTLGGWFREYVYIPLGGNRVPVGRWVVNLFVVWFLTGLWHGAAWTFVLWGLFHGLLLLLEKVWRKVKDGTARDGRGERTQTRTGALWSAIPAHIYTLLMVMISMVIFEADSLSQAAQNLCGLVGVRLDLAAAAGAAAGSAAGSAAAAGLEGGAGALSLISPLTLYYLRSYGVLLAVSMVGSTPLMKKAAGWLGQKVGLKKAGQPGSEPSGGPGSEPSGGPGNGPDWEPALGEPGLRPSGESDNGPSGGPGLRPSGEGQVREGRTAWAARAAAAAEPVLLAGLLMLVTAYLVDGSYNPFLYFRF